MKYIFKITNNTPLTPPSVGDTNIPLHYSGINLNMAWAELTPTLRTATEQYLLPFVGPELYNQIADKFDAGTFMSAEELEVLTYMQDSLAAYIVYAVMPHKLSVLSSMGNIENTPEAGQPTNQWRYKEKRLAVLSDADAALDRLLSYLHEKTQAGITAFNQYRNSTAYSKKTANFIRTTEQLDDYVNLKGSRRSFLSLVPHFQQIERKRIKPVLCTVLYDLVVSTPTDYPELTPLIREAVAYLGAASALPHHRVVVDGDGFRVVSTTDGFDDRRNLTNSVHEQAVGSLLSTYQDLGEEALKELVRTLEANLSEYPAYRDSTCRSTPPIKSHGLINPSDGIGAVGIF
jgi:hypothetical protein